MTVNPFWFGFLMGIVAMIFLSGFLGMLHSRDQEKETEFTKEEYKRMLEEMTGKKFEIKEHNGFLVGEPIEPEEEEEEEEKPLKNAPKRKGGEEDDV